jgi:hypothetical protein
MRVLEQAMVSGGFERMRAVDLRGVMEEKSLG